MTGSFRVLPQATFSSELSIAMATIKAHLFEGNCIEMRKVADIHHANNSLTADALFQALLFRDICHSRSSCVRRNVPLIIVVHGLII